MKKSTLAVCCFLLFYVTSRAQEGAPPKDSVSQLLSLPLEKLMDIPIYSASKEKETSFDAPVSSAVATREQIKNAGCTSIMEALRLLPGVIVREQTNGNYDIHILGLDNIPPNSNLVFFSNSTTLVMIDNRPVYNYLHGGTFWETLPITLNDVERIELVRGPSAPLYGPNAVTGVINIITRRPTNDGLYAIAHAQYGSLNTLITQASLGYKFNNKLSAWVSGNFQRRDRSQETYYDVTQNRYVPIDSVFAIRNAARTNPNIASQMFPHPWLSMYKYGYNGFVNYDPADKVHFALAIGGQNSEVQDEFAANLTPINTAASNTQYADLRSEVYGFDIDASHLLGTQSPSVGQKIWKWDLNTTDVSVEYDYRGIKNLDIRPGIYYRQADYNDSKYINASINEGLWSGDARTITRAAALRFDYHAMDDKLRLIAAGRLDNFNFPVKSYFSYQVAATYKLNDDNIIRACEALSYRSPLLIDVYTDINLTGPLPLTSPSQTYLLELRGNKNIALLSTDMQTIGWRSKLTENLAIDIDAFHSLTKNFSDIVYETGTFDSTAPVAFSGLVDINNLAVRARQFGSTLNIDFAKGKWEIKPFITVQKTILLDYSQYNYSPNFPALPGGPDPKVNNIYSNKGTSINQLATPGYYGGLYANWRTTKQLNCNINAYYYDDFTELESSNLTYHDGSRGVQNALGKFILNAAVTYKFNDKLSVFANFRNILNENYVEFYKGDQAGFMMLGGINLDM